MCRDVLLSSPCPRNTPTQDGDEHMCRDVLLSSPCPRNTPTQDGDEHRCRQSSICVDFYVYNYMLSRYNHEVLWNALWSVR